MRFFFCKKLSTRVLKSDDATCLSKNGKPLQRDSEKMFTESLQASGGLFAVFGVFLYK